VARIGFGAMQLPGPGVSGPPRDRDTALAVLRRAVELGVNHIDRAQFYGPDVANELIRSALAPYPADLVPVSKVGAERDPDGGWTPAQRPDQLRAGPGRPGLAPGPRPRRPADPRHLEPGSPDREPWIT
jgi:aryl-alcohol dehydrogenase-like predicted oxidoreductase